MKLITSTLGVALIVSCASASSVKTKTKDWTDIVPILLLLAGFAFLFLKIQDNNNANDNRRYNGDGASDYRYLDGVRRDHVTAQIQTTAGRARMNDAVEALSPGPDVSGPNRGSNNGTTNNIHNDNSQNPVNADRGGAARQR
ncbi:hypothetical protein JL720_10896 [Aureococcus anophagefferens]|nr:hypothetical protein JL720_10896 [Aureococcus anophagefferens]